MAFFWFLDHGQKAKKTFESAGDTKVKSASCPIIYVWTWNYWRLIEKNMRTCQMSSTIVPFLWLLSTLTPEEGLGQQKAGDRSKA